MTKTRTSMSKNNEVIIIKKSYKQTKKNNHELTMDEYDLYQMELVSADLTADDLYPDCRDDGDDLQEEEHDEFHRSV